MKTICKGCKYYREVYSKHTDYLHFCRRIENCEEKFDPVIGIKYIEQECGKVNNTGTCPYKEDNRLVKLKKIVSKLWDF
jgi:hypothetical protein